MLISFSFLARMLFSQFWDPLRWLLYILSISRSVRVDAADLHLGLLVNVLLKGVSLSKISERLPPGVTGSVVSRVQKPDFFAVGEVMAAAPHTNFRGSATNSGLSGHWQSIKFKPICKENEV